MIVVECLWLPSEEHRGVCVYVDVKHSSCSLRSLQLLGKNPHSHLITFILCDGNSKQTKDSVSHKVHQKKTFIGSIDGGSARRDRKTRPAAGGGRDMVNI